MIVVRVCDALKLELILEYMYKGQINVPEEELNELLKLAEEFQVKGLAVPDIEEDDESKHIKKNEARSSKRIRSKFNITNKRKSKRQKANEKALKKDSATNPLSKDESTEIMDEEENEMWNCPKKVSYIS